MTTDVDSQTALATFLGNIRASANTKRCYKNTLTLFAREYGHLPESSGEAQEFIYAREKAGLKPATVGLDVAAFLRYFKYHSIPTNRLEKYPVVLGTPTYLSESEISKLLGAARYPILKCLIALLYDTGARISEVLNTTKDDIDWNGGLKVIRKGGREEVANVSEWGLGYLATWLDVRRGDDVRIFGNRTYHDMYMMLKTTAKKAGIPYFKPHMIRHSRAVHLRDQGVSWEEIGYQLGHVNPTITVKYYTRPDNYDLKKAIPAVQLTES
jgi:integrase/recombinase XerD